MTPRDTTTGAVLEAMILPALKQGGYAYQTQVRVGQRPGGRTHKVDAVAEKDGKRWLVSVKWQQVGGTTEQKVPFEVMCLSDTVVQGGFVKAYLVLGGEGWRLREFYVGRGLDGYLRQTDRIEIVTLEGFIASANQGRL